MRDGLKLLDAVPGNAPQQYSTADRCTECGGWLSRYNRYTVCGPCRTRLSTAIPVEDVDLADDVEAAGFSWERFPKRTPVHRGPVLEDSNLTGRAGVGGRPVGWRKRKDGEAA